MVGVSEHTHMVEYTASGCRILPPGSIRQHMSYKASGSLASYPPGFRGWEVGSEGWVLGVGIYGVECGGPQPAPIPPSLTPTCKSRVTGVPHLQKKCNPLGPYRRPMPRVLGGSWGGGCFLMGEVPL